MLDRTSVQAGEAERKEQRLAQAIPLLSPLIGLFAVVLARSADLGPITSILLLAVTACSVYVVLGQPLVLVVKKATKAMRAHYLVPRYRRKLGAFIKSLQRFCDRSCSENPACVLRDFPPLWGGPFKDPPALHHLTRFADALHHMVSAPRWGKKDLVSALTWFELTLHMYNRECVCDPLTQIANRLELGVDEGKKLECDRLRRQYQRVKTGYVLFLEDYANFARDLNADFGENIAGDYFEKPGEL